MSNSNQNRRSQNSSTASNVRDSEQLIQAVNELVSVQAKDQELRAKELQNESDSISSNERIALASIEAQKGDRSKQIDVYSRLHSQRHLLVGISIIGVIVIIAVAMYTNNTGLAKELIKMVGAILLAYISYQAGLYKGRSSNTEDKTTSD